MATITLQLGNYSNYVASHLWNLHDSVLSEECSGQDDVEDYETTNLYRVTEKNGEQNRTPRTILLDLRENIVGLDTEIDTGSGHSGVTPSIWGGVLKTVERSNYSHVKPDWTDASQTSSSGVQYWSDYLQSSLHPKSYCEMPLWTNQKKFDTFFAGQSLELVPPDVREDLMDRVRYFAEECDNLQCVRVFADIHDGFAEDLKDEYSSAAMPVWAFTGSSSRGSVSEAEAPTASSTLRSLGIPLSYLNLSEHASVVIPIGDDSAVSSFSQYVRTDGADSFQSSAAIALAIETAEGNRHLLPQEQDGDRCFGPKEWCHAATRAEAGFCPIGTETLDPIIRTFEGGASYSTLNPFLKSLSAVNHGPWALPPKSHVRTGRAFSNLLSVRGPVKSELSETLYSKCLMTSYLVTACSHRRTPLILHKSFPSFFSGLSVEGMTSDPSSAFKSAGSGMYDEEEVLTRVERCAFMAAVGCDSSMGKHVGLVADTWRNRPNSCRAQLEKVGMGSDECREVLEGLTDIKCRSQHYPFIQ